MEYIDINLIKLNPKNPRIIKDDKYKKLLKSIQEFPEMLALRPIVIDETNTVLGGNMRLKALTELGHKKVNVIQASELTEKQKNEFIIYDPFCGSGTTIVAGEQLGRKVYAMEIDPKYCQVIIDRMRTFKPELVIKINGKPLKNSEITA